MIDRRTVVTAAAGLAAAPVQIQAQAQAASFDIGKAADTLPAFARLTGNIKGGAVLRWHTGTIGAVLPGEAPKPLVAYDGLEKEVWTANCDGTFTTAYFDIGYFKNIGSTAPVESWNNPVTGDAVPPMTFRSGRFVATLNAGNFKRDIEVRGDDIMFTSRSTVAFPAMMKPEAYALESAGPLHFFSVVRADHGRISEATDPRVASAPLAWSYTLTTVWLPWMKMGGRPGAVVWTGIGGKYRDASDVPAGFKAFLDREQPDYLTNVEPWSEVRNMWGDYMRAHPPAKT